MYPGWSAGSPAFKEIRPESQNATRLFWGPLPAQNGEWKGVYVYGKSALLSYTIQGIEVLEMPGSEMQDGLVAFTRTFRVGKSAEKLYLNVAEVANGVESSIENGIGSVFQGNAQDSVTAVAVNGNAGKVLVLENRYMVVELPHPAKAANSL